MMKKYGRLIYARKMAGTLSEKFKGSEMLKCLDCKFNVHLISERNNRKSRLCIITIWLLPISIITIRYIQRG